MNDLITHAGGKLNIPTIITRLNQEDVERQIAEMWAALDQGPSSDDAEGDLEQAKRDAVECEQRLRARLAAQDRLDQAAPKLLNALDLCEATLLRLHQKHQPGCLCIKGTLDTILDAKKAALLEAP